MSYALQPTLEARAESNLFELCLARRRKAKPEEEEGEAKGGGRAEGSTAQRVKAGGHIHNDKGVSCALVLTF